jgi:hypothetical protein
VTRLMQAPPQRPAGYRVLLPTGAGPLLTGSSDGCVRLWDAARPDSSYMVCGPPQLPDHDPAPSPGRPDVPSALLARQNRPPVPVAYVYSHKTMQGVGVLEELCIMRNTDLQVCASLGCSVCGTMRSVCPPVFQYRLISCL